MLKAIKNLGCTFHWLTEYFRQRLINLNFFYLSIKHLGAFPKNLWMYTQPSMYNVSMHNDHDCNVKTYHDKLIERPWIEWTLIERRTIDGRSTFWTCKLKSNEYSLKYINHILANNKSVVCNLLNSTVNILVLRKSAQ